MFYGIITVHKPTPALWPIVAAHSWVTSPLAHVAAKKLQPDVVRTFPDILSSTPELVRDLEELTFTPSQVDSLFFITGDVEGLYASIQQDQALATVGGHLKRMLQGGQINPALRAKVLRVAMNKNAYMRYCSGGCAQRCRCRATEKRKDGGAQRRTHRAAEVGTGASPQQRRRGAAEVASGGGVQRCRCRVKKKRKDGGTQRLTRGAAEMGSGGCTQRCRCRATEERKDGGAQRRKHRAAEVVTGASA